MMVFFNTRAVNAIKDASSELIKEEVKKYYVNGIITAKGAYNRIQSIKKKEEDLLKLLGENQTDE